MRTVAVSACSILFFCMFCGVSPAEGSHKVTPAEMAREGWHLLERDMPAEALDAFKAALKADPNLIDAHRGYQDAMIALHRGSTVRSEYRKRADDNPDSAAACYLYSRVVDDADQERQWLERALKKDEKFAWAHYGIARLLLANKDIKGAESHLKRALELQPDMAHGYKALALLYIGSARTDEAEKVYLEAAGKLPGETFHHAALAEIYLSEKRYEEALKQIDSAVKLRKDVPHYHTLRAEILHCLDRNKDALESLRAVLELEPTLQDSIEAYKISEEIATPKWDLNEADMELYKMAIDRLDSGNLYGALTGLNKLVERKEGVALLHYQIGRIYQHKGDIPKALTFLERAVRLEPDYADPYYLMARIHYNLCFAQRDKDKAEGHRKMSEKFALHTISLHPFYPFPYKLLGEIYHQRGDYEKAVEYAAYFYKIRHNYAEIRSLLIDQVRIVDKTERPQAEFRVETFNVKVYPGRPLPGRRQYVILRFHVYRDDKIHKYLFAEVHSSVDEETGKRTARYYLCDILDDANNTHDGFLSDEGPPSMTDYELAIREVLALEALED